jgi:hypothetical protein
MSGEGEISDNIAMIKDKNDVVTYSVKVNNIESGTLSKYEQYIAIPKKNSIKDDDLIEDSGVDGFDFTLAKQVYFTGTDIFNVYYTVEQGLNYTQMRGLSSSKWYTYAQLVESYRLDDVTGIKVLLKNTVYNDFDTTINVDMKPSARNNEIKPGEINTWKSIGNYVFKYSNGKVAGYICTNGCKAQTAVSVEEKPTDSARLLDDTPSTGDTLTSEIYKWILLAVMSLLSIMLMKYSNIINKKHN